MRCRSAAGGYFGSLVLGLTPPAIFISAAPRLSTLRLAFQPDSPPRRAKWGPFTSVPGGSTWTTRILGIDPGLNITGYGVLEIGGGPLRLCEAGVVRGKTRGSLTARLLEIHQGVADVIMPGPQAGR